MLWNDYEKPHRLQKHFKQDFKQTLLEAEAGMTELLQVVRYDMEEAHRVALGCWVDVVQDQVQQDTGPRRLQRQDIGLGLC